MYLLNLTFHRNHSRHSGTVVKLAKINSTVKLAYIQLWIANFKDTHCLWASVIIFAIIFNLEKVDILPRQEGLHRTFIGARQYQ